jgi:transposase
MYELNFKNLTFIMDQGFETEENLVYLKQNKYKFIIPFPESRVFNRSLIEKNCHYVKRFINYIEEYGIYGLPIKTKIYGITLNAHLFFDQVKAHGADLGVKSSILKLEEEILKENEKKKKENDIIKMKKIPKKYSKFFLN